MSASAIRAMHRCCVEHPASDRAVLWYLAIRAARLSDLAWPAISTIADATRLSDRQVQRALRNLAAAGLIVLYGSRKGGRARSAKYVLDLSKIASPTVGKRGKKGDKVSPFPATGRSNEAGHSPQERVTGGQQKGDAMSPEEQRKDELQKIQDHCASRRRRAGHRASPPFDFSMRPRLYNGRPLPGLADVPALH